MNKENSLSISTSFVGQKVYDTDAHIKGTVVGTSIETNALSVMWDNGFVGLVELPSEEVVIYNKDIHKGGM